MSLKETLLQDLKTAMKDKDTIRKNTIQLVRAGVLQIEKDNHVELEDDGVLDVIAKELKKRRDSLPEFEKSGRTDLIENLNKEIDVLLGYLPEQLTEDEIQKIVEEREKNGQYKGFTDFCERIADEAVNKKCVESLIKAGTFDEFEQTRSTLLASFENIIDSIQSEKKKGLAGQVSMFDMGTQEQKDELNEIKYKFEEHNELPTKELLSLEKEMLGIYISGHPLQKLREQIEKQTNINTMELRKIDNQMNSNMNEEGQVTEKLKYKDGQQIKYAGIITSIKKKYTKNNKIMAFVTIEDLYGVAEIIVFENAYIKAGKSLVEENIVMVEGRLSIREDDRTTIIANDIKDFGEQKQRILTINITDATEEEKDKLRGFLRYFCGDRNNINVQIQVGEECKPCGQIYLTDEILNLLKEIVGEEKVSL